MFYFGSYNRLSLDADIGLSNTRVFVSLTSLSRRMRGLMLGFLWQYWQCDILEYCAECIVFLGGNAVCI